MESVNNMKKIALFSVSMIAMGIMGTSGVVAHAEGEDPIPPTPVITQGKVALAIDPDASHPGGDGNDDGGDTGQKGEFTLDHTASYDFGEKSIDGKTLDLSNSSEAKPYVQVTDLRENSTGWQLAAKISEFQTADKAKTLTGAEMKLPAGTSVAVDESNISTPPTTSEVTLSDVDSVLFQAAANTGVGSWMDRMYDAPATLHIPAGATPGAYQADITWTLTNAPGSDGGGAAV